MQFAEKEMECSDERKRKIGDHESNVFLTGITHTQSNTEATERGVLIRNAMKELTADGVGGAGVERTA